MPRRASGVLQQIYCYVSAIGRAISFRESGYVSCGGKIIEQNTNARHSYLHTLNKSIMLTTSKFTIANSK